MRLYLLIEQLFLSKHIKYLLIFNWHIRYRMKIFFFFNTDFKCGFESWFIKTRESTSSMCWLKLGGC